MTVVSIALDTIREAFARKLMLGLFIFIVLGLLSLVFALDLEVVEGTLAAGRLFGLELDNPIIPLDVAMGRIFSAFAFAVFYSGLMFGIVATASIAADMLAPGRVELLLSLPVRRWELVVGTYFGVLGICLISTVFAVGGVSLVLFVKAGFVTIAPVVGAVTAVAGFMAVYAVMLFATSLVRSPPLAAASGLGLFIFGVMTSNREAFLALYQPGFTRDAIEVLVTPVPKFHRLATLGAQAADSSTALDPGAPFLIVSTLTFAAAFVAAACYVVSRKDY